MTDQDDMQGRTYWVGERGPELTNLVGPMKSSMTFSGFYDDRTSPYAPWFDLPSDRPIQITVQAPKNRWQAYKAAHATDWWMRWLVRLRPVRYGQVKTFTGYIESVEFGVEE